MNVLEVAAQVTTLSESFNTGGTAKGTHACVLPEVVSQVAALPEDGTAALVTTLEVKLDSHGLRVSHFDCLVPAIWYALERLLLLVNTL
jgi:hypothetical protein